MTIQFVLLVTHLLLLVIFVVTPTALLVILLGLVFLVMMGDFYQEANAYLVITNCVVLVRILISIV